MIISVHQPQYLPWLGFFDKVLKSDCFVVLDKVQYKHREFQNRNKIRTKDGWIWLTVPVFIKGFRNQLIRDVVIDDGRNWRNAHWHSLKAWYGKAPFFKEYAQFFERVYERKWEKLIDLNMALIEFILNELSIDTKVYYESELGTTQKSSERIVEICKKLNADTYLSGAGGKEYLDEALFKKEGIALQYQEFNHPVYSQLFMKEKNDFIPCLSTIDLLFNEGKKSGDFLSQ